MNQQVVQQYPIYKVVKSSTITEEPKVKTVTIDMTTLADMAQLYNLILKYRGLIK